MDALSSNDHTAVASPFSVDGDCQIFSPNFQLVVMVVKVYYDGHCIIDNGNDVDDDCQTFSPNCAVKLPMSPSIRGKPVHVFAENCSLISSFSWITHVQQDITPLPNKMEKPPLCNIVIKREILPIPYYIK